MKRLAGGLLAFAVSAVLCLVAVELVGQRVLRKKLYFVDNVDHRMKPHDAETNGDGVRDAREPDEYREDDWNVVFLGDSFLYGAAVERKDAIPQQFERIAAERLPGRRVRAANFGWTSSSPLLSYRLLRDIGAKYHPDLVVMCVDMTDFQDDVKYTKLLERKGIFRYVRSAPVLIMGLRKALTLAPPLERLHERVFGFPARRFFVTDGPIEKNERYFATLRASIDSIDSYCARELDARFAVVVFPRSFQYSDRESPRNWEKGEYTPLGPYALEPFRWFDSFRGEVAYPIHSLLRAFQGTSVFPTCLDWDPHWNAAGNRVAAEAIFEDLSADGFL